MNGEFVLREIINDIRSVAIGTDGGFFIKPLSIDKAKILVAHINEMNKELVSRRALDEITLKTSAKLALALSSLEEIANSKFPVSGAKVDMLQERARELLDRINEF